MAEEGEKTQLQGAIMFLNISAVDADIYMLVD
jgi:hypothetical protein